MKRVKLKSEFILEWMIRHNLSLRMMAKEIGVSVPFLSQMLNGNRCPSPRSRNKIQHYFEHVYMSTNIWDDLFEIIENE